QSVPQHAVESRVGEQFLEMLEADPFLFPESLVGLIILECHCKSRQRQVIENEEVYDVRYRDEHKLFLLFDQVEKVLPGCCRDRPARRYIGCHIAIPPGYETQPILNFSIFTVSYQKRRPALRSPL